ncbi:heavy metal-associated isoprenylated plant protein 4 isoform X2 [Gossypium arboreum]|uniref:heavy metal-associated isoprenylated plant protein 4 isoform X2 n=1 Tax=Gossypium arboreum TaxID=29729 RepID=UPI0022F1A883|nr:heavy metal-associated isoprenylated plant protein 4 isoform X2 [Gossypium arboreum]
MATEGVITAVYKVNLHCRQCACDIKKPLMRTQGVHGVELDVGKGEIKVKGVIDVIKTHKMIEKVSKRKVEILSPQIKITDKDKAAATPIKPKETKKPILRTTTMKVHLHCDKCEQDLRNKLLKHKEMISSKTMEAKEEKKEIVKVEPKKEEKKEIVKVEAKKEEVKVVGESSENKIVKSTDANAPYFVHYVYAPQLFSDENPNACTII